MENYGELARQAVDYLRPALEAARDKVVDGAAAVVGAGAATLWTWIKGKFTRGAQAGAVAEAEAHPRDAAALDELADQLRKQFERDEAFRTEFVKLLPEALRAAAGTRQTANVTGNDNTVVQVSGDGAQTHVSRGGK